MPSTAPVPASSAALCAAPRSVSGIRLAIFPALARRLATSCCADRPPACKEKTNAFPAPSDRKLLLYKPPASWPSPSSTPYPALPCARSFIQRQRQGLLDFFHHDITLGLRRARQLQQDVAEQLAVFRHAANARLDQVIEVARHQVALLHFRDAQHFAAELFEHIARLVVQRDLHEHQQGGAQRGRIDARVIAADDAVALHALDALDAGR